MRLFRLLFWGWLACSSAAVCGQTLPFDEAESAARLKGLMARINQDGASETGGLHRLAYSDEDRNARNQIIQEMIRLGLRVRIDAAGNIIGRRNGQGNFRDAIVIGSPIDSVRGGGGFDGVAGIAAALEVIELMNRQDRRTVWSLEVVVFHHEGGHHQERIGSLGWLGKLTPETLLRQTESGYRVGDGIKRVSGRPDKLATAMRSPETVKAFLELHIDEGNKLHGEGRDIGIVSRIVGLKKPVLMDPGMIDLIERKARFNDYGFRHMLSGAGHDAQHMVSLAPTAMIFVPSLDGISHDQEKTGFTALARGAKVMLDTVLGIDALQLR